MSNADPPGVVERAGASSDPSDRGSEPPTLASLFGRRMVVGALGVVLVIGAVAVASRSDPRVIVPSLIGARVDPQLDTLRLRLEAAGLVLGDVAVAPCPEFDVPGASLQELPGTIVDQRPTGGEDVVSSTAVDVTVCLPDTG